MNNPMTQYVSMLMFSPDLQECVVITKDRPKFLAGKLCPVGGHVEENEDSKDAACREFHEETDVCTAAEEWQLFSVSRGADWTMDCYYALSPEYANVKTTTSEPVSIHRTADLLMLAATQPNKVAPDLIALIGLALQAQSRNCLALIQHDMPTKKLHLNSNL